MKPRRCTTDAWPYAILLLLAGAAFSMACRLSSDEQVSRGQNQSLFTTLLGRGRTALSSDLHKRADLYFHKGVGDIQPTGLTNAWFQVLEREISPTGHKHAEGKGIQEIMPWLRFATQADPANIEAWLVAAFWMMTEAERPDLAEDILIEARTANPAEYEIEIELGRLYLETDRISPARRAFDRGLRLWPSARDIDDKRVILDKVELLIFRALLYEVDGERLTAAQLYEEAQQLHPQKGFALRIKALRENKEPSVNAQMLREKLLNQTEAHACDREQQATGQRKHEHGPACDCERH